MRIEEDLKLDFTDVLIRPKRSTLTSRSDVDISRDYSFRNSKAKYRGIPIIASDRKSTRLNSSHVSESRMPSSA